MRRLDKWSGGFGQPPTTRRMTTSPGFDTSLPRAWKDRKRGPFWFVSFTALGKSSLATGHASGVAVTVWLTTHPMVADCHELDACNHGLAGSRWYVTLIKDWRCRGLTTARRK
jgi:hypothetical protein